MKHILHPDFWCEIPAGEYLTGLSDAQRQRLSNITLAECHYDQLEPWEQETLQSAIQVIRQRGQAWLESRKNPGQANLPVFKFSAREERLITQPRFKQVIHLEEKINDIPPQTTAWLERFFISRYPITIPQVDALLRGDKPLDQIPGATDETGSCRFPAADMRPGQSDIVLEKLGARLPTAAEWEKAARGVDGRLYPWGDEWNPVAGDFHYGASAYFASMGVSPYGVWEMAGGLPEPVTYLEPKPHWGLKGCHPKNSSPETAWIDHLLMLPGRGMHVGLRPVLDRLP